MEHVCDNVTILEEWRLSKGPDGLLYPIYRHSLTDSLAHLFALLYLFSTLSLLQVMLYCTTNHASASAARTLALRYASSSSPAPLLIMTIQSYDSEAAAPCQELLASQLFLSISTKIIQKSCRDARTPNQSRRTPATTVSYLTALASMWPWPNKR